MSNPDVLRWLQQGRRQGAAHLWLSGGEPTLRRDFLQTLRAAKHLGYQRIKVQSNGMLFAYEGFAQRAVLAGMTEVNLLLKSLDPALHDELNRTPGSHALLHAGLERLATLPVRLEGDILLTRRNYTEVPALVAYYAAKGLRHFNIWLFSLSDQGQEDLSDLVPRMADAMPFLADGLAVARAHGATFCSLHTPPCTVPAHAREMLFDVKGMQLVVVNPDGRAFALEQSVMELGVFAAACTTCAARPLCSGLRQDYLDVHGSAELAPLHAGDFTEQELRGSALELPG